MPRIARDSIDENKAQAMLRCAIDNGVNFLDLPYLYDAGRREKLSRFIGRALQDGYRDKIKIAAGLPSVFINSAQDFECYLDTQLELLQIDRLDFFLLAGLDRQTWPELPAGAIFRRAETAMGDSRLGNLGFSLHDDFQTLRAVIDAYDNWAMGEFQYSFMDVDHHPGTSGLKYAADKGLAVVITEPLKGGRLAGELPGPVAGIWAGASPERKPAEWGLRWVWSHPEITTAVVDMSSLAQVKENVALASKVTADSLTVPEELLINRVRDAYFSLKAIPCTGCRGCMPCPQNIDVPRIFELYNDAVIYGNPAIPRSVYRDEGHDAAACSECGLCVKACGRRIIVTDWLPEARRLLGEDD